MCKTYFLYVLLRIHSVQSVVKRIFRMHVFINAIHIVYAHHIHRIYKSRHEPIGVRGFLSCFVCFLCNKVFGIFGAVVREPKRRDRCTMLLISRYFPLFSLMLHMLDPYFPLFSVGLRYFGELFIEVSRIW